MSESDWNVLVRRDNFGITEVRDAPRTELEPGEVRLSVERFGVTANNVAYAKLGELLHYYDAFPAPDGWARVPAWGFATVEASRHPDHAEGTRVFGLLPMSTRLTVSPEPTYGGFSDSAPHRRTMHPFYRRYRFVGPEHSLDGIRTVLRPVFPTSLLLADAVSAKAAEGAQVTALVSSASSKTALGLAYVLAGREGVRTHGLTSDGNIAFVRRTGLYDAVTTYDTLGETDLPAPVAFIDFAGAQEGLQAVHERFAAALVLSVLVGGTRADALPDVAGLPGPAPTQFSVPDSEGERIERVGAEAYYTAVAAAEDAFVATAGGWLRADDRRGSDAVVSAWADVLTGRVSADTVRVLHPGG